MQLRQWIQKRKWMMLAMGLTLPLAGCNLANSADSESAGSDEPSASLTIKSVDPVPNTNGSIEENAELTLVASGIGSKNSGVKSCDISLYRFDSSDVFGTTAVSSIPGCGETIMVAPATGRYKLVLTVTDNNDKTAKTEKKIEVAKSILNAEFTVAQEPNKMQMNLDASTSTKGAGGEIVSYLWKVKLKLDDLTTPLTFTTQTNSSPETSVVVNSDGIYVVELTVTDKGNNTDVEQKQIEMTSSGALIPNFNAVTAGFTAPGNLTVQLDTADLTNINSLTWSLFTYSTEDGLATSPAIWDVTHVAPSGADWTIPVPVAGLYIIELKVINNDGNEHRRRKIYRIT